MAAAGCEVVLRQRICFTCRNLFWICRHCDRGHRYCSASCRDRAYRQQRRLANRRHQQSPEGRLDHRDRQRAHRWRRLVVQKSVTDESSLPSALSPKMPLGLAFHRSRYRESPWPWRSDWLRCLVCGRRGQFVNPYR
jgi:hypothetical protein